MEISNRLSNSGIVSYPERQTQLLSKYPLPEISPTYADYSSSHMVGSKGIPKSMEEQNHLQRTPSESFLAEEQPFWVDELLNEPETPVHRGHRRSSSDSFAYLNTAARAHNTNGDYKFKHITAGPSWGCQIFNHYKDLQHASINTKSSSSNKQQKRVCESSLHIVTRSTELPSKENGINFQNSGSLCASRESEGITSTATEKQDQVESGLHNLQGSSERGDAKPSVTWTDQKHVKQQFTHRSQVKKVQYIAELERYVQALQAEGFEVSAELEFLDQQNLILGMENAALKQWLDSLTQVQLIKYLETDMLEREIGRLQTLYQQKQQQQQLRHSTYVKTSIHNLLISQ